MSVGKDTVENKGNQVIHIRGDSDSELQALFDSVLRPNENQRPQQVPLRLRNFPPSFFNPPSTGSKSPSVTSISHSRDSSADSTTQPTNISHSGLLVHHPRAHSSPASLQQTYATAQQEHIHLKQQSYDITDDLGPLPAGWGQAKTAQGQIYFLNHVTQTTTWEDPRKIRDLQSQNLSSAKLAPPPPSSHAPSPQPQAIHLQRPAILQQAQQQQPGNPQLSSQALQARQQKLRLQRLQRERELLRVRQQEIKHQDMLMRRSLGDEVANTGSNPDVQSITNLDPFLSSNSTDFNPNQHPRQESADSGLEMGTNYSLPHTPDNFLSSMEDIDSGTTHEGMDLDESSSLQPNGLPAALDLAGNDLTLGNDVNDNAMDDLVPSLQLTNEELSSEIFNDVQALLNNNKMDNGLVWL